MSRSMWVILVACLLGCYASACHGALKTFSKRRLAELLKELGKPERAESMSERLPRLVLMTGVLRTTMGGLIMLTVLYATQVSGRFSELWVSYLVAFLVGSVLLSVFLVAIPVSWARYSRERLLAWSAPLLQAALPFFVPIASGLHLFDPVVRRISGADLNGDDENDISEEVLSTIEDHDTEQAFDDEQKAMLGAIFDLKETSAGEIMTPRTDVDGLEADVSLDEVKKAVVRFGHSRIPVYEESLDQIVGILYVRDLIRFVGTPADFHLRQIAREPFLVPESKNVLELLKEFKQRKVHLAIVLDEYGGTAGLITIEDILEEIVGDIRDEYDEREEDAVIADLDSGEVEIDARVEVDDMGDHLEIDFDEDRDYDTVGGFVFAELGHIPEVGEAFEFEGYRFTVTQAERTKVLKVRAERLVEQADLAD
ncbi:MAG: hemolysin family protein, partial [Planctomycetota bacterium]